MLSDQSAGDLLGSLASLIRTSRVVAHRSHGNSATGTQIGVLKIVSEQELRLGDLATHLMVAPSVASRVVAALEADGLVSRHPDPADARACLIGITDRGRRRLEDRQRASQALLREVLSDWQDEEAREAVNVLRRLESRVTEFTSRLADQPGLVPEQTEPGVPTELTRLSTDSDRRTTHVLEMEHQPA